MEIHGSSADELASQMREACRLGERVTRMDLSGLNGVTRYTPEDMTVTVSGGCTLAALQAHLAGEGQWLPLDPPSPETLSVADLIVHNRHGPRR
jgi:glycolate oxidase FAD binding subunit